MQDADQSDLTSQSKSTPLEALNEEDSPSHLRKRSYIDLTEIEKFPRKKHVMPINTELEIVDLTRDSPEPHDKSTQSQSKIYVPKKSLNCLTLQDDHSSGTPKLPSDTLAENEKPHRLDPEATLPDAMKALKNVGKDLKHTFRALCGLHSTESRDKPNQDVQKMDKQRRKRASTRFPVKPSYPYPQASSSKHAYLPTPPRRISDEDFAREIQAQLDAEENAKRPKYEEGLSSVYSYAADAELARRLQEEFDNNAAFEETKEQHEKDQSQYLSQLASLDHEAPTRSKIAERTARETMKRLPMDKWRKTCEIYLARRDSHDDTDGASSIQKGKQVDMIPEDPSRDPSVRVAIIANLLYQFDQASEHNKERTTKLVEKVKSIVSCKKTTESGSSALASGTGYGGDRSNYFHHSVLKDSRRRAKLRSLSETDDGTPTTDDIMTTKVFKKLKMLLLEQADDHILKPTQLQALFLCSSLLDRAATLLQNHDLVTVTSQKELYLQLIAFLQVLAEHPSTSILAFGERIARTPGDTLSRIYAGQRLQHRIEDTTRPLYECMDGLASQCKTMIRSGAFDESDLPLFSNIVQLHDFFVANTTAGATTCSVTNNEEDKVAWHKDFMVMDIPDETIMEDYGIKVNDTPKQMPGRVKRCMQEITRLQASLPSGIFVRYGISRPDILKCLIIGPKDSPYENGLFEFDLYCGPDFPQKPPEMLLRTTGGGRVGFNPNLYSCGKVCLSLLGTWSGEPWTTKSTLLQILVSIQAMIFCEEPWYNEPGRESRGSDRMSRLYNQSLWPRVVQHGMLDWLERRRLALASSRTPTDTTVKDGIWDEIVRKHFQVNEKDIESKVKYWIHDLKSSHAMSNARGQAEQPSSHKTSIAATAAAMKALHAHFPPSLSHNASAYPMDMTGYHSQNLPPHLQPPFFSPSPSTGTGQNVIVSSGNIVQMTPAAPSNFAAHPAHSSPPGQSLYQVSSTTTKNKSNSKTPENVPPSGPPSSSHLGPIVWPSSIPLPPVGWPLIPPGHLPAHLPTSSQEWHDYFDLEAELDESLETQASILDDSHIDTPRHVASGIRDKPSLNPGLSKFLQQSLETMKRHPAQYPPPR